MAKSKPAKKTPVKPKVKAKPKAKPIAKTTPKTTPKTKPKAKAPAKPVKKKAATKTVMSAALLKSAMKPAPTKKAAAKKAPPKVIVPRMSPIPNRSTVPHLYEDATPKMTAPADGDLLQSGRTFSVTVQTDFCQFAHQVYMFNTATQVQTDPVTLDTVCTKGETGSGIGTCNLTAPDAGDWQFYIYYEDDNSEAQRFAGSTVKVQ